MPRVYWVTCPYCQFRYYVGHTLVRIPGFPTCCPRCHREFPIEQSNPPIDPPVGRQLLQSEALERM